MKTIKEKKSNSIKKLRNDIHKEFDFLTNIFSICSMPHHKGNTENELDIDIVNTNQPQNESKLTSKRARSITELEEKLHKMKSEKGFNLKTKLMKKSLNSKLNKKLKKKDRVKMNTNKGKPVINNNEVKETEKPKPNIAPKPVFNNEGKLVFSKFDFANLGRDKISKGHKDPKKILDDLKTQEKKVQQLAETDCNKAKEMKETMAWKNILQKAEGQKVKDDPILLKKSIKRMEQKKKSSKKQWENRLQTVESQKEDRQKKRKENILKKKKEKKTKVIKASVKRGRVVI
ncbi:unnamed protein product [Leptidea sinapis]|uniref:Ribosomal RNA-processing protein 14/surfeit locus protein 6 C-terminal domain-containing protein n=1 Tax=Leptidea sinapis TaxID=189913 RepID=A0A5E4Q2U5_9NEOP|nr:unnamed protein product [Leptidea sinapis]